MPKFELKKVGNVKQASGQDTQDSLPCKMQQFPCLFFFVFFVVNFLDKLPLRKGGGIDCSSFAHIHFF